MILAYRRFNQFHYYYVTLDPVTCPVCLDNYPIRFKRIVLEPDSVGPEDVFTARGLGGQMWTTINATQRFKDLCESYGLRNTVFTPALEYSRDLFPRGEDEIARVREYGKICQ